MRRVGRILLILLLLLFVFPSLFPSLTVAADPGASWPTSWIQIDWDKNENDWRDDWRDVEYAYYQYDSAYLYLKLECYDTPGKEWPNGKDGRYKWFIDLEGNMYYSGGNIFDAEYLIFVEDTDNNVVGEMYLLFETNGDNNFGEYEPWPPTNYTNYLITNPNIGGWRIVSPNQIEMYISWDSIGNPSSYWITWATDQENPNLDQGPTTDRVDEEDVAIEVHDVAAISQTPTPTSVAQGETVTVEVVAENQGTQTETFNVTCYFDTGVVGTLLVTNLAAGNNITLNFSWDTTGVTPGTYNITAWADSDTAITEIDEADNWCTAPATVTVRIMEYYLTVVSPYGVTGGQGWYDNCTTAYATLDTGFIDHGNGTRRIFTHWSGDATGTDYSKSDPIHMDGNKTAIANWKTRYLVTFDQTGLDVNATGTVVTVNGSAKTFGDLPFTWWIDNCSWVEYSYSVLVSSLDPNENFTLINVIGPVSTFHVGSPVTVTGNYQSQYKVQYYLDVSSGYGTPGGMGWYDDGDTAYATLDTDVIDYGNGTRRVFTHWSGDATGTNYAQSDSITMDGNKTAIANWKTQYYLTVSSVHGTPGGEGWYNASDTAYATITPLTVAGPTGVQYVFTGWSEDASGSGSPSDPITMDGPKTAVADWKTQYYLTVVSPYGTPGGEGWYDSGSTAYATVTPLVVSGPPGVQYVFTGWSGDASGSSSPSDPIVMDGPKTATADWKTQYYLTVTSPYDSPTPTSGWFDAGTSITASVTSPWPGPTGTRYICTGWTGTGSVPASGTATTVTFTIDAPSSITWTWITQYYLTVKTDPTGLSPAPTPPSGWYNESTNVLLTAQLVTGYTFLNWDVDGTNVTGNPINVHMDQPHTATARYQVYVAPSKCVVDFTEDPESPIWFGTTVTFTVNVVQKAFNGTHEVNCTLYEWNLTDPKGVSHILRFGKQWNNFSDTMQWTFNVYGSWTVTLKAFCNDTALIGLGMAWSDPASHVKYVSMPVGGYIVPVCKLDLLVPWTGFVLGLLAALAATIALFRLRIRKH